MEPEMEQGQNFVLFPQDELTPIKTLLKGDSLQTLFT